MGYYVYGDDTILKAWRELKDLICQSELDAHKATRGVYTASVQMRRQLTKIRKLSKALIDMTREFDKTYRRFAQKDSKKKT